MNHLELLYLVKAASKEDAPNYHTASAGESKCNKCLFAMSGYCNKYQFEFGRDSTCNSWTAKLSKTPEDSKLTMPGAS